MKYYLNLFYLFFNLHVHAYASEVTNPCSIHLSLQEQHLSVKKNSLKIALSYVSLTHSGQKQPDNFDEILQAKVKLKDNSTIDKTEAQIVSYGILYVPTSYLTANELAAPTASLEAITVTG